MEMLKAVLFLLAGFVLLIKGADFFVSGSSSVARSLRVPSLIIGLTIVSMGTSLPELSVSITASLAGHNALAVSNVIGSNLFNLMVVLGASALLANLSVGREVMRRDFPISVACAVLLLILGYMGMELGRVDGLIFCIGLVVYLVYQIRSALAARKAALAGAEAGAGGSDGNGEGDIKILPLWRSALYIIGGAAAVKFGGDWVVDSAQVIAAFFGMSENLIGLTIVSMGTSLPELVTSVVAARKNEVDMAIGNVVGSNILNILMILGVASLISPIGFNMENVADIGVLLGFSVMVWIFCATQKRLSRVEGAVMLFAYAAYAVYICLR